MNKIPDTSKVLLRWTIGKMNTVAMADYELKKFLNAIWLTRLSILSFQKWFPEAKFVLLYNGDDFKKFEELFYSSEPKFLQPVELINQPVEVGVKWENPYHYWPVGVWWKWVPFRLDADKHEIAIDTDIICISRPQTWYDWLESSHPILIAPERFKVVKVNTCGDLWEHPSVVGKPPFNCGVVGQRAGHNYAERFFNITRSVHIGETHDSMFITEQGVVNVWVRSLELEGISFYCLDFQKNAWIRDFLYFILNGVQVETVHAVTWHKDIVKLTSNAFVNRIMNEDYSDQNFIADLLSEGKSMDVYSRSVLSRQMGDASKLNTEILIPGK